MMGQGNDQFIATLISFALLGVVLFFRLRKARRVTTLKIERLWMLPAFYGVVVAALYVTHPPVGVVWLYALGALAGGGGLGWYRGTLMNITVDAETQELKQQGSVAAMLFIVLLIGVRFAARSLVGTGSDIDPAVMFSLTDVLLALGLGFISAQRVEMGMRARDLLARAKRQ